MNRLIIGTACLVRLEVLSKTLSSLHTILSKLNNIEIYWLLNIDKPKGIKTSDTEEDVASLIKSFKNSKIKMIPIIDKSSVGFYNAISNISKYIDENKLFTTKTCYMYFEDDLIVTNKTLNLNDYLSYDLSKKIIYLGYPNSTLGCFGPHIMGKNIFDVTIGTFHRNNYSKIYGTQNAEDIFQIRLYSYIYNNNNIKTVQISYISDKIDLKNNRCIGIDLKYMKRLIKEKCIVKIFHGNETYKTFIDNCIKQEKYIHRYRHLKKIFMTNNEYDIHCIRNFDNTFYDIGRKWKRQISSKKISLL